MSEVTYTPKQMRKMIDEAVAPYRRCLNASWRTIVMQEESFKDYAIDLMVKAITLDLGFLSSSIMFSPVEKLACKCKPCLYCLLHARWFYAVTMVACN